MKIVFYKKFFIILMSIVIITCLFFKLKQYQFGHFINGPITNYSHEISTDILTLDNGDLLILGSNCHQNLYNYGSLNDMQINETPFEIYNPKENNFTKFSLPNNIAYQPMGLLLNNYKLLLTFVYDYKDSKYSNYSTKMYPPYPYDSMAIVDLKNKKIEKIIQKKINKHNQPNFQYTSFTLLGNGKILIIDFFNKIAEIYNPNNNSSEILNLKIDKEPGSKVIANGYSQALIFGATNLFPEEFEKLSYYSEDYVEQYDDNSKTLKQVGKTLRRSFPSVMKISQDKIIIFGGEINTLQKRYNIVNEIEIYNPKINESKIIAQFNQKRKFEANKTTFSGNLINDKLFLITGGVNGETPFKITKRSSEILNLETGDMYQGPNMKYAHANHQMIKLNDGNILIIGGRNLNDNRKTELFKIRKGVK